MRVLRGLMVIAVGAWLLQSCPSLRDPPTGAHAWRETDGLIVARNYRVEQAPFLEPRVNNRDQTDGVTGLELPWLNYASARLSSDDDGLVTAWRVISLCFGALLAWCLWRTARIAFGASAGLISVICFATSPLVPYFSRTTQPDITAAALAMAALAVAVSAKTLRLSALAFALATASALSKLPAAVYLLPVLLFTLANGKRSAGRATVLLMMGAASAALALGWYRYARLLELRHGLTNFGVSRSPAELLAEWQLPAFWLKSFLQRPFDVWLFPPATVALLGVLLWRRGRTPWRVTAVGVTVISCIFLCGYSGAHHEYYGLILLPGLTLMIGWAVSELAALPSKALRVALAVLAIAAVGWQVARGRGFWAHHQTEWAELRTFSEQQWSSTPARVSVFSDGSPQLFWFTGQVGRFADVAHPALEARDTDAMVDRLRLKDRSASIETALEAAGCEKTFENAVAWVCRATARPASR